MDSLPQEAATAAAWQKQAEQQQLPAVEPPEHILFDIMDVCVVSGVSAPLALHCHCQHVARAFFPPHQSDPFYTHMAAFFGLEHEEARLSHAGGICLVKVLSMGYQRLPPSCHFHT